MMSRPRARVFIVEDDFLVAESYRNTVDQLGYEVVGPSPSVEKALAVLEDEPVDVALLDVMLRGRVVTPVARRLVDMGVPFIFLSGAAVREVMGEEFRDAAVLEKPTEREDLEETLRQAVSERRRPSMPMPSD